MVRLAVLSDVHMTPAPERPAAWHHMFDFAGLPDRIERAGAAFERAGVDAVVVCGDVAHAGDEASTRAVLARLPARPERPALVVAGNHDRLEGRLGGGSALLTADGVELGGVRVAGVAIERDGGADVFRWTGAGKLGGGGPVTVVASHFPVLSRAARLAEAGLAYPGDLTNRRELHEHLLGAGPVVVLSGHIHARDSHTDATVLQLSAGALVEAPYEVAIVDVRVAPDAIRVRRRALELGPPDAPHDAVLAPAEETWAFAAGGWRRATPTHAERAS